MSLGSDFAGSGIAAQFAPMIRGRLARINGRAVDPGGTSYAFGPWVLREVERVLVDEAGTEVALSSGEYHLLHALVRHPRVKRLSFVGSVGTGLAIPASLLAAWAPSVEFLIVVRVLGGFAAGMAFPTTLALITALWSGPARTRSIALWSALGGGISALGPLVAGGLFLHFYWGSVFLVTLPLAVVAFVLA